MDGEREQKNSADAKSDQAAGFVEGIKLSFENVKQLATLSAGSIVIIGTFMRDIFPSAKGTLAVSAIMKLLWAASFVGFGLSLALSAYVMHAYSQFWESYENYLAAQARKDQKRQDRHWDEIMGTKIARMGLSRLPLPLLAAGLICFGLAVVLNLYR